MRLSRALGSVTEEAKRMIALAQNGADPTACQDAADSLGGALEEARAAADALEGELQERIRSSEILRRSLERVAGVIHTDDRGIVLRATPTAGTLLGLPVAHLIGKPLAVFVALEDGRRFRSCLAHAQEGTDQILELVRFRPRDTPPFDARVEMSPRRSSGGEVTELEWVIRDQSIARGVAAERDDFSAELLASEHDARAEAEGAGRRLAFLADASRHLSSSFDYRDALTEIGRLAVSDVCAVFVAYLVDQGQLRSALVVQVDSTPGAAKETVHTETISLEGPHPAARALRDRQARFVPEAGQAFTPDERRSLSHHRVSTLVAAPVMTASGPLGVILMGAPGAPGPADLALVEDLATRVGLAADNNRYVQELREEQRRKDVFLAMLAHELRNPLAAVSNAHNAIRLGAGDQRAVLDDIIERQTDKLARLVSDLLDVSRIRLGKIALRRQHLDLRQVAERTVGIVAASHPRSQGAVALDLPVGPVWVDADPDRMEQIVYNLLDNAVKYSPGLARVTVSLTIDGDEAVLRVRDGGIGISAEFLPEVFGLFTQRPAEGGTPASGLGLGLALVKGLVAEHGGSVAAHSEGIGHGSEFTVRLPRSTMLPFEAGRAAAPGTRRHRVLIVEDNDDGREALRLMLLHMGHEVSTAAAGEEGVAVALASLPDIALIDVGLPDIDGYEVARRIRGHPSGARMRLVALTGYGQPADRQQALDAGFNAHAVKPLPPERLARILDG